MTCCPDNHEETLDNTQTSPTLQPEENGENTFEPSEPTKTYVEASYREEEMKSSSVSFLIVAVLLVVVTVLVFLDIIPIAVGSTAAKALDVSVLLAMALIFFGISLHSMKRAKELSGASNREVALTEEILEYCLANYKDPASDDSSETDQYFERETCIRKMISGQYKGLTDSYLDYLVEIVYSELYPEQPDTSSESQS